MHGAEHNASTVRLTKNIQQGIYTTEKQYIGKTTHNGNIFKGWDAGANATRPTNAVTATTGRGRAAKNPNNERLFFSLSSLSAPKTEKDEISK